MSEKEEYYNLYVRIPKELNKKFYTEIVHKYGRTHGNIPNAVKEAITYWVEAQKKEREEKSDFK